MEPAIFLDRDGVIIENCESYVRSWDDVTFLPGSLHALARLKENGYRIVIVTNQSVVGRGMISASTAKEINREIEQVIKVNGGRIDGIYMCPHAPDDSCDCRKPKPGLLLQAAEELSLDLTRSIMIGDALDDLRAGQSAGVARKMLVLTGRGQTQLLLPSAQRLQPFEVYASLSDAVDQILAGSDG